MIHTEHRTISVDFTTANVQANVLDAEIRNAAGITTELLGVTVRSALDNCDIVFNDEPSASELTVLRVILLAHPTPVNLDAYKLVKGEEMGTAITTYLYARYDQGRRESLVMHYQLALAKGLFNRASKIQEALDWVEALHLHYADKITAIASGVTQAEVDAVVPGLEAWELLNPDPHVTIRQVIAILD